MDDSSTKNIAELEAALRENAEDGTALANLLDALLAAGREAEAVARAVANAGAGGSRAGSRASNWLGWYYMNTKNDLPRALEHLERAVTWGGWWGVAHLNYGAALEMSGDVDKAYSEYDAALMSGDSHDPAMAHARMGAIEYGRGWLLHALSSARRALVREERAPRGRAETWRADTVRIESELTAKGTAFPSFETEKAWIELELAQKREGLGVDRSKKLSKIERAWLAHENRRDEEVPPSGPLAEVDRLLRERKTDAALAELARVRRNDGNLVIDAIGLMSMHGEIAAREKRFDEARALLARALEGYEYILSGSSNQGEAENNRRDVTRMRERLNAVGSEGDGSE